MKAIYTGATSNNFINGKIYLIRIWFDDKFVYIKNLYGKEQEQYESIEALYNEWEISNY